MEIQRECIDVGLENADVRYYPRFIKTVTACNLFDKFLEEFEWKIRETNYGKEGKKYRLNRATCAFGDEGVKAPDVWGTDLVVLPWTPEMMAIKTDIECATGLKFNICLCNYYANGKRGIGFHADNEERGSVDGIASVSLGSARRFIFRKNSDYNRTVDMVLANGSLLIMGKGTQESWTHAVPIDKDIEDGRINLTFRWFDPVRYTSVAMASQP